MGEILGKARSVHELLSNVKYSIDYYQREYKWQTKQVRELIDDLSTKFLDDYKPDHSREAVEEYGHYFLGAIIISRKNNLNFIVDGQQRLTTLTLLLIYLNNLQRHTSDKVPIDLLIFSEKHGRKSFNLHVEEREPCMEALFEGDDSCDEPDASESVRNILARYQDMKAMLPEDLTGPALPYFIDWLVWNVHLVEITAYSDEDAYTVFETMNDRGLSLTSTDMLKGYVLANIPDSRIRNAADAAWRKQVLELSKLGKEMDADAIKAWLRSQYSRTIRERKKGAHPEDFDRIGTEFHRWVRDKREQIGLVAGTDFSDFINDQFSFYSQQYIALMKASKNPVPGLERILYNADNGFTLQYMLLLAPLSPDDDKETIDLKLRLVSTFVDILITWRIWNAHSIAYSTMQYAMFLVMREIRGLAPQDLAVRLWERLHQEEENFTTNDRVRIHQQNQWYIRQILARITDYVDRQSGEPSRYLEYVERSGRQRYEVEHIWANKAERHTAEFPHQADFAEYRNRIGGLLLLPKSFNASYGDLPYEEKLPHYYKQNLLACSLNPLCYERNPDFLRFVRNSGLSFKAHEQFLQADLDDRQELYRQIAERIWDPDQLLGEIGQ